MSARRAWLAAEPLLVMLAVIGASWWLYLFGTAASPFVKGHYDHLNTALFLYVPLVPILFGRGAKPDERPALADYGLTLAGLARTLAVVAVTLAVIAPLFVLAVWLASRYGPSWCHPAFELHVPRELGATAWFHLVQVALPEEFFFRGYAQGRLDQAFPGRARALGAPVGFGLLAANALFALAHPLLRGPFQAGNWWRLDTFLPGLLFGWLRARTGSVVAPVLMHCASNLMLFAVIQGS